MLLFFTVLHDCQVFGLLIISGSRSGRVLVVTGHCQGKLELGIKLRRETNGNMCGDEFHKKYFSLD